MPKKQRKAISSKVKLKVIEWDEKEERAVDIGQALGLAESTLQYIRPNADKIKASDRSVTPLTATKVSHS